MTVLSNITLGLCALVLVGLALIYDTGNGICSPWVGR